MRKTINALSRWAVLAVSALLCACTGSLLQSKVQEPQTYVLLPAKAVASSVPQDAQLAISWPTAAPGLDTARIAVLRAGHELDYFLGARWGGTAPQVVQSFLISFLQSQQSFKGVVAENARVDADYLLQLDLRDFQAEYAANDAAPMVHVTVVATLIDIKMRRSRALLQASASVAATENRLGAVVAAFQTALQQSSSELSEQLSGKLLPAKSTGGSPNRASGTSF